MKGTKHYAVRLSSKQALSLRKLLVKACNTPVS